MSISFRVHEIFDSIQFEGMNCGKQARFVRFYGCNLKCSFCDTDQKEITPQSYTTEDLLKVITVWPIPELIVLTGGEPTLQPIGELLRQLKNVGLGRSIGLNTSIAIETNGKLIEPLKDACAAWPQVHITVSPKYDARIFEAVALWHKGSVVPSEFKFIIGPVLDFAYFYDQWFSLANLLNVPIYLQPGMMPDSSNSLIDQMKHIVQGPITELFKKYSNMPLRLSLQGHKLMDMR